MVAKASSDLAPSGYDEEFVSEVDIDVKCLICHLKLKEPVQTKCGHRFCKDCLEEHFKSCPVDGGVLDRDQDVFHDKAAERKIDILVVKCSNEDCKWTGELKIKKIHLETCLFKAVSCTNEDCHEKLKRKDLEEHLSNTCEWKIIECEHCKQLHPKCRNQDHLGKCNKFPINCSNSCGDLIPRQMIQRKNLVFHLYSATRVHLDFACVKLNTTQVQSKETQDQLKKAQTQMNDTQLQLLLTQEQLKNTKENLEQKVEALQRQLEQTERTDQENGNTLFIWKINSFSKKWRLAQFWRHKTIKSNSFFTGRFGYRLKVSISPDEDATHLLILIVVMKSKYDAILPWPFHRKVTYTLIDQQENPKLRGNNVVSSFVNCNRRFNEAFVENVVRLVSYDQLQTRRFLMDDTCFFRSISVRQ